MVSWQLTNLLASLLIPPGLLLVLLVAGLAAGRRFPATGRGLLVAATAGLYALSTPLAAALLLQWWEPPALESGRASSAQAIVVLGAGKYHGAPEYGGDTVGSRALVRLRYAATLHRGTGLPVMVSGGSPEGSPVSEAQTMREALKRDFGIEVRWSEAESADTLGNARQAQRILQPQQIRRILLVTHGWHMPRAELAFRAAGFEVIAAPTALTTRYRLTLLDLAPNPGSLLDSALFFHEAIGTVWYRVRLFLQA